MNNLFREFLVPLKTGTRFLLGLFVVVNLAQWIGERTGAFDLMSRFALQTDAIRSGQIWRLVTYALITPTFLSLVTTLLFLAMIGSAVERVWSAWELWLYCLVCSVGAALVVWVLAPASMLTLAGNSAITFGLLVAWGRLFAYETILLLGIWKTSVRNAVLVFAILNLLLAVPRCGWLGACVLLSGGVIGWIYLSLRWKCLHGQQSQTVTSARIGRLEL